MKKEEKHIEKKTKPSINTFGFKRKKQLKPTFMWWGWKTI